MDGTEKIICTDRGCGDAMAYLAGMNNRGTDPALFASMMNGNGMWNNPFV